MKNTKLEVDQTRVAMTTPAFATGLSLGAQVHIFALKDLDRLHNLAHNLLESIY